MALAAPGIAVDLLDEFADGMNAVADHLGRVAARRGDEMISHHQQAEIIAGNIAFNHDLGADFGGGGIGRQHAFMGLDIDGNAFALIAVLGFDHHRAADFTCRRPGILGIRHGPPVGYRNPGCIEQFFGQFLVLGDGFGNGAGAVCLGGLDAALPAAPAELHHAARSHAPIRDAARHCGLNDGAGAGPEALVLIQFAQACQCVGEVEGRVVHCGAAKRLRELEREPADLLLAVFDHDLEYPWLGRCRSAAEGHRTSGLRLQPKGGELQRMRHGNGFFVARRLQGADFREPCAQPGFEVGHIPDQAFTACHNGFNRSVPAPQIGAAQCPDA